MTRRILHFKAWCSLALLLGLTSLAHAAVSLPAIKNTAVNGTAMTVQVVNFPTGPLVTKVIRAQRGRKDRPEHQALKDRPARTVPVDW